MIPDEPVANTTTYTHLRAQATFHMATNQFYVKISISSHFPPASELIELDDRHWLATLPAFCMSSRHLSSTLLLDPYVEVPELRHSDA
jgi:hypothetical protein